MDYSREADTSNLPQIKIHYPCQKFSFYSSHLSITITASSQNLYQNYSVTQKAFHHLLPEPSPNHFLNLSREISELLTLYSRNRNGLHRYISTNQQKEVYILGVFKQEG